MRLLSALDWSISLIWFNSISSSFFFIILSMLFKIYYFLYIRIYRLRPTWTSNHSVSWPSITTAHSILLYSYSTFRTAFGSTPMARSIFHSAFLHVVSNATLKSMKLNWSGTWCSFAFSIICRTIKMASIVPRSKV